MYIQTAKFGQIDLEDKKIIEFPFGLPGFEDLHRFIILEIDESKPLFWLQSTDDPYVALPAIIPFDFMEDYFVEIRDCELEDLHIECRDDLFILNIVVIPKEISKMTANLAAPIIINARLGIGKQIIIDAKELPVRFPIFEIIMKKLKGGDQNARAVPQEG